MNILKNDTFYEAVFYSPTLIVWPSSLCADEIVIYSIDKPREYFATTSTQSHCTYSLIVGGAYPTMGVLRHRVWAVSRLLFARAVSISLVCQLKLALCSLL